MFNVDDVSHLYAENTLVHGKLSPPKRTYNIPNNKMGPEMQNALAGWICTSFSWAGDV